MIVDVEEVHLARCGVSASVSPMRAMLCARGSLAAAVAGMWPTLAHACTVCDSHAGRQVRAGILDGHFVRTLALVALPFPVLGLAAGLLHFGMPELGAAESEAPDAGGEREAQGARVEAGEPGASR